MSPSEFLIPALMLEEADSRKSHLIWKLTYQNEYLN